MIMYESEIEHIALEILRDENHYDLLYGPDISEGLVKEREYTEVVLSAHLRAAVHRINPNVPDDARDDAYKRAMRSTFATVIDNNEAFHKLLTDGVDVKYGIGDGRSRSEQSQTHRF